MSAVKRPGYVLRVSNTLTQGRVVLNMTDLHGVLLHSCIIDAVAANQLCDLVTRVQREAKACLFAGDGP